jgi:hypothetical protein
MKPANFCKPEPLSAIIADYRDLRWIIFIENCFIPTAAKM